MTETGYRKDKGRSETMVNTAGRRGEKAHAEASYKLLKILLILLGAILAWAMISWALSSIPLKRVHVEGLTRYGEEEVLAVSGLATAEKMLEVDGDAVKESLMGFYPYIEAVRLRYAFPMGYRLVIVEEEPVYYTRIANDYFALSSDLKVLERATSSRRFLEEGLQQISLSGIQSAMLGQTLDYGGDYLDLVLEEINGSVLGYRVTDVVLGDRYHLSVMCDDLYTLYLGDIQSIDAKLQLAALMLEEADIPEGYRATLDVSDLKKTSIRYIGLRDAALAAEE